MCDEYEAELIRMGLIEEARKVRNERHGETRPASTQNEVKAKPSAVPSPKVGS
jgi:hypothetical protein